MSRKSDYEKKTEAFILPILGELGFSLYDVEYVKEGGEYFLRVYIDKPGGVTIDDCVETSRRMNEVLDREDYIADAYTFEVSSPGVERRLRKEEHFLAVMGEQIELKLYAPKDGKKQVCGILKSYDGDAVVIDSGDEELTVPLAEIALAKRAFSMP